MRILHSLSDEHVEVHVDLTHDVNYMPTLLYKTVRELLQLLAYTRTVVLHVYNSEPFAGKDTPLNVHLIEKTELRPSVPPEICGNIMPLGAYDRSIGKKLREKA